eukprot:4948271-Heterocapsa_arctica.AAC.1
MHRESSSCSARPGLESRLSPDPACACFRRRVRRGMHNVVAPDGRGGVGVRPHSAACGPCIPSR